MTSLRLSLFLLFGVACSRCASAFVAPSPSARRSVTIPRTTTARNLSLSDVLDFFGGSGKEFPQAIATSRGQFFLWFFGSSGAAGIARSAFPRMYKQVVYIQSLKGAEPTLGGEKMGISFLCGYPEDLAVADVQKVVNNPITTTQMVEKFPIEGNFLSTDKGYLTFKAFELANAGANPLAVRAVFDTFSQSTDLCSPTVAQSKLDAYKEDLSILPGALLTAKITGYSAIFFLLFLLGLADIVAASEGYHGWFPEWPGGTNFPWSMFTEEGGAVWQIKNYWI